MSIKQSYIITTYAQEGKKPQILTQLALGIASTKLGLAFDILDSSGNLLEGDQYKDAIHWLHTHAHEYGFIVRFQEGKELLLGISLKHGTCVM